MIPICTEIEGLIHPEELRSDEYIVNDGLIYCSKCHTPRQKRIEVSGKTIEPRCMGACQGNGENCVCKNISYFKSVP